MVTISTHNGSSAHRDHNIRNEKVVSKEDHIDKEGVYEIWKDETPIQAYHKLFDKAVERYNKKQTREDRKIINYYSQIKKDDKKHPVYEMIIGVYPSKGEVINKELQRAILKEFVDGWQVRNSNLYMCGAYYHADEQGEPHVHIDYIPVAHGYSRGMDTQTGLVKALGEQGFFKEGRETAQIKWEHKENEHLEKLCKARGLGVEHPKRKREHHQHIDTETYKKTKELQEIKNEIETLLQADTNYTKLKNNPSIKNKKNLLTGVEYVTMPKDIYDEYNMHIEQIDTSKAVAKSILHRTNYKRISKLEKELKKMIKVNDELLKKNEDLKQTIAKQKKLLGMIKPLLSDNQKKELLSKSNNLAQQEKKNKKKGLSR